MKYQRKIERSTVDGMYVICSFYEIDSNLKVINQSVNFINLYRIQSSIFLIRINYKVFV